MNKRLSEIRKCQHCGADFHPFRATGRFCSTTCKSLNSRVDRRIVCAGCGITFISANQRHIAKYCSNPCYHQTKTNRPLLERLYERIDKSGDCWTWTGARHKSGYGKMFVDGKYWLAHRLLYLLETGEDLTDKVVRHYVCDNPPCCRLSHLRSGTQKDNLMDAVKKNRHSHGETSHSARLTEKQVIAILNDNRRNTVIAREYGVVPHTIGHIKTGYNWKHLHKKLETAASLKSRFS